VKEACLGGKRKKKGQENGLVKEPLAGEEGLGKRVRKNRREEGREEASRGRARGKKTFLTFRGERKRRIQKMLFPVSPKKGEK